MKAAALFTGGGIRYDLANLPRLLLLFRLNPPSADVVNSITTPGMNKYTWHGDIFEINMHLLEKTLLSLKLQED